jgi:hypothetical protein
MFKEQSKLLTTNSEICRNQAIVIVVTDSATRAEIVSSSG